MPSDAPNGNLKIMAYVKAAIAILLVITACIAVVMQIELPSFFVELILGVLGIYFGFSALLYNQSAKAHDKQLLALIQSIVAQEMNARERN